MQRIALGVCFCCKLCNQRSSARRKSRFDQLLAIEHELTNGLLIIGMNFPGRCLTRQPGEEYSSTNHIGLSARRFSNSRNVCLGLDVRAFDILAATRNARHIDHQSYRLPEAPCTDQRRSTVHAWVTPRRLCPRQASNLSVSR